ncbi:MAG: CBS domain-containing protein [Steroidobacteraceae bacterium]
MKLKELCTPDVVSCTAEINALHAARLMRDHHVGDLVILDENSEDGTPIGIVTDRDIVVEVLAKDLDPAKVTLREIMRVPLVLARASEEVEQALERMRAHGVRRVPMLDDAGKLAGIISLDDLLRRLAADAAALVEVVTREQDREHRARR